MNAPASSIKVIQAPPEATDSNRGEPHTRRSRVRKGGVGPLTPDSTSPTPLEVPEWPVLSGPRANVQHTMHAHTKSDDGRDRL